MNLIKRIYLPIFYKYFHKKGGDTCEVQRVFLVLTKVHTEWVVRYNVFEVLSLRKMAHHLLLMREELPWFASVNPPNHDRHT